MSPFEQEVVDASLVALQKYHDIAYEQFNALIKIQSKPYLTFAPRDEPVALELHLPDESRTWSFKFHCPVCGHEETELIRVCNVWSRPTYQIRCLNQQCRFTGPKFKSSEDAVQNWRCHQVMAGDERPQFLFDTLP